MRTAKFQFIVLLAFVSFLIFGVESGVVYSQSALTPIKVGLVVPLSGAYAKEGEYIKNGLILAFDQAGDIAGRKVKVTVEDTEMKPDVGVTKIRKLVEHDKVHFTAGAYSSAVGLAIRDFADKYQVPHIFVAGCTAIEFITTRKSEWCRHPVYGGPVHGWGLPDYLVKDLGFKRVIAMGPDYAWGWSEVQYIKAAVEKAGGKVVQQFLTPFPTLDYAPYLAKLAEADVLYTEYAGADAPRLVRQAKSLGIKMQLAGSATFMPGMLKDAGLSAVGAYGAMVWVPILKTPENLAFMRTYKERFGEEPGLNAATSFTSTLAIIDVLRKIGGKIENRREFLDTWYTVEDLKTPLGNFSYEKSTESGIQPVYIYQIVEEKGAPTYKLLKEIPVAKPSDMLKLMGLWKE